MAKLNREQIVTIQVLHQQEQPATQIARILGVTEGTVHFHCRRAREAATDGRQKPFQIQQQALDEVVQQWWQAQLVALGQEQPPSVQALHEHLRKEHDYRGSYKSVHTFVRARFGPPRLRLIRRVETPPGAQTQSDWAGAAARYQTSGPRRPGG